MTEIKSYDESRDFDQVVALYKAVNWLVYTDDSEKLRRALSNSHLVLVAYSENLLSGLIRCVSDGEVICYIQDILVTPVWQRQGIGKELVNQLMSRISVRQTVLMTDNDPSQLSFYRSLGFRMIQDDLNGFVRIQ